MPNFFCSQCCSTRKWGHLWRREWHRWVATHSDRHPSDPEDQCLQHISFSIIHLHPLPMQEPTSEPSAQLGLEWKFSYGNSPAALQATSTEPIITFSNNTHISPAETRSIEGKVPDTLLPSIQPHPHPGLPFSHRPPFSMTFTHQSKSPCEPLQQHDSFLTPPTSQNLQQPKWMVYLWMEI